MPSTPEASHEVLLYSTAEKWGLQGPVGKEVSAVGYHYRLDAAATPPLPLTIFIW